MSELNEKNAKTYEPVGESVDAQQIASVDVQPDGSAVIRFMDCDHTVHMGPEWLIVHEPKMGQYFLLLPNGECGVMSRNAFDELFRAW